MNQVISEQEFLDRIIRIANSGCKIDEARHVSNMLEKLISKELMHAIVLGLTVNPNPFPGPSHGLAHFIAGAYAAIHLKENKESIEELQKLWKL